MKRFVFILVALLITAIMLLPLNSCTWGDTNKSNTFIELLKLAPADTLSDENIILINYDRIWEDAGISFYKEDGSKMNREEILDTILSITYHIPGDSAFKSSSFYSGLDSTLITSPIQYDTLGYNLVGDVHAEIGQGHYYNNFKMVAMIGDFSIQATSKALQNQDTWPESVIESFTTESYLNVPVYSWGDNSDGNWEDRYEPPHIDDYGIARPLSAMDGYMFIGTTIDSVKKMISTAKGDSPSLADVPEYKLVAEHMDYLGVYAMMLSDKLNGIDPDFPLLPLGQYLAAGYGDANDERGQYTAVIAVYENEDITAESADILEGKLENIVNDLGLESDVIDI